MFHHYIFKSFIISFIFVKLICCVRQCNDGEYIACRKLYDNYMVQCNHYGYGPDCASIITSECDNREKTACDNFKQDYPNVVNCHISNLENNCKAE